MGGGLFLIENKILISAGTQSFLSVRCFTTPFGNGHLIQYRINEIPRDKGHGFNAAAWNCTTVPKLTIFLFLCLFVIEEVGKIYLLLDITKKIGDFQRF